MQVCNPLKATTGNLGLFIDLDERGIFMAHVENAHGETVYEISNEDEDGNNGVLWLVEDGFMKHSRDTEGLLEYLQSLGIASSSASMGLDSVPYDPDAEDDGPLRRLICCCCGAATTGRQFHNQDRGYGLGSCCVEFVKPRTDDMERTYGKEGVHYLAPTPPAPKSPQIPFNSRQ